MTDEHTPIGDAFSIRRSIGNGFLAVRTAAAPMWLAGMLLSISDGCNGTGGDFSQLLDAFDDDESSSVFSRAMPVRGWFANSITRFGADSEGFEFAGWLIGAVIAAVVVVLLIAFCLFALNCWLLTGFVRLHVNILEHASDQLTPLFSGRDRFWPMAGYKLLAGLAVWAAIFATSWPGALLAYYGYARDQNTLMIAGFGAIVILALPAVVYVALGVFLGELTVVLDGATPVLALRRSWALARGNRMPLLGFSFVCGLVQFVSLAGLLLCCVGALATVPFARSITGFAKTEGYLLFTRGPAHASRFALWHKQAEEDRPAQVAGWGEPPQTPPAGGGTPP